MSTLLDLAESNGVCGLTVWRLGSAAALMNLVNMDYCRVYLCDRFCVETCNISMHQYYCMS